MGGRGGLVGWEVFQFKSLRFLGPPGVIFIHIHSHWGCCDGAERPSVRIGRVCHTVHLIWCQTDVQITVEPLESIVCLHQCHFRICLSMTSLRSFHPADLSTPYEKTCSRCTQPADSPPPFTLSLKSICSSVDLYPPYFMAGQKSEKESQSLCCAPLRTELQISVALEAVPRTSPAEFGVDQKFEPSFAPGRW